MELSLRQLVGEVVMLWQLERVDARSLSRFCWLSSLSLSLPHHFIGDCKEKWSLGLFGHVGALSSCLIFLYDSFLALVFLGLSFGM